MESLLTKSGSISTIQEQRPGIWGFKNLPAASFYFGSGGTQVARCSLLYSALTFCQAEGIFTEAAVPGVVGGVTVTQAFIWTPQLVLHPKSPAYKISAATGLALGLWSLCPDYHLHLFWDTGQFHQLVVKLARTQVFPAGGRNFPLAQGWSRCAPAMSAIRIPPVTAVSSNAVLHTHFALPPLKTHILSPSVRPRVRVGVV